MSSPIWLALHCPKCLSLSHQITSSQKIYYHLGQLLRHSSEIWGMGSVFNEPATAAFCARFVSWMDSRCSPKMNALYWSSLEVTGFWKATRNRFQTRRTHGKIVSQLRAHIHLNFFFPMSLQVQLLSQMGWISQKFICSHAGVFWRLRMGTFQCFSG